MTETEIREMAEIVAESLRRNGSPYWVEPNTHKSHHDWVSGRLKAENELVELKKKIVYSACIWAVPIIIAWATSSMWASFVKAIFTSAAK